MEDDPLSLETRRRIFAAIRQAPGSGAREVQRAAATGWGETTYHLDRLTQSGLIHRERSSSQDHYFVAEVPLGDRRLLGLTRSASARRLLVSLIGSEESTVPELTARTGLSEGRLSVHLRRLIETGVVQMGRRGRWRTFVVGDRERVVRLLVTYREGFTDSLVEGLVETWSDLFRP
ncbi:MAG: winged helix-turn-helix transcriptional regulator [Thermoplasmata archaeon]